MICYKDMTFCTFWKDCKEGEKCPRALTQKVRADAKKWLDIKPEPPICIYTDKPECFIDGAEKL